MTRNPEIAVIGLGYIGLPTATVLANSGFSVIGVDVDEHVIDAINSGRTHIDEPKLEDQLAEAVKQNRLRAQRDLPRVPTYIIAVPTPFLSDNRPDLSYINTVVDQLAHNLVGGELIILESTCPPGTTDGIALRIKNAREDLIIDGESGAGDPIYLAHCPERVLPGRIMTEIITNSRVIGGISEKSALKASTIYRSFAQGQISITDLRTAEMTKLVENSFRDVNIAFANELSIICDRLNINVRDLIYFANQHPRVNILDPGPGVGGHCIAVDPWFIVDVAKDDSRLIKMARSVNDDKPSHVLNTIEMRLLRHELTSVVILGLSFKPNVADVRESPAVKIVKTLALRHPEVDIQIIDPHVTNIPPELENLNNVSKVDIDDTNSFEDRLVVGLVRHPEFLDEGFKSWIKNNQYIDSVGILNREYIGEK